jgi:Ca2+-binding RTX toxin-like protein
VATINGTKRSETIDASARSDNLIIHGRGGNDTIHGGTGVDALYGDGGSDHIYASPYDSLVDGGTGNDTVNFSGVVPPSGYGVDVRLFGGHIGLWPNEEGAQVPAYPSATIKNVENVIGSNYDDAILGSTAINKLNGGGGDDWMIAYGSGDFLTGGTGADMFSLENAGARTTVIDFDYSQGDRLFFLNAPNISWIKGTAPDASGISQPAWKGTYVDQFGNTELVIVLGTAQPTADWIVSLG